MPAKGKKVSWHYFFTEGFALCSKLV